MQRAYFTDAETAQIGKFFEVINMLLWCIGQVPHVLMPTEIVDMHDMGARVVKIVNNPKRFIKPARPRPASDILDMLDPVFRMHNTAAEANNAELPIPGDLRLFMVYHRHGALAWVTDYEKVMDGKLNEGDSEEE